MLLLGVLAAQAEAAAPAGVAAYDLLETEILTGSQASVTFSSLDSTYGADYQHLQIRTVARTDRSSTVDFAKMTLNGASSNYSRHYLLGDGSSVSSGAASGTSFLYGLRASAASDTADVFGVGVIDILDPFETTKNTTTRTFTGASGQLWFASGLYYVTDAITTITFTPEIGTNFVTGSRFSLYGLRSA